MGHSRMNNIDQTAHDQTALDRAAITGKDGLVDEVMRGGAHGVADAFGERLRELRQRQRMSQDDLARAAEIHLTAIGRMERGGREPRLTTILRLAEGLGVEPGELVDRLPVRTDVGDESRSAG